MTRRSGYLPTWPAGRDPAALRDSERSAASVVDFAQRYLREHAEPKKKTRAEDRRLIEKHITPAIGRLRVADVTRADVTKLHLSLRDTPYLANRVLGLVGVMFSKAEDWGIRAEGANPARRVGRFPEERRERFLSNKELARIGTVLAEAERDGSEPWQAVAAIRFLLLTGRRRGEALTLRWDDVNLGKGRLRLRDSKTGKKNFPLAPPARDVLSKLPRIEGNPYIFPARFGSGHFVGLSHVWKRLRAKAKLPDVRIHDLRHAFASVGVDGGESLPIIGALLGHVTPAMTARYAHLSDNPVAAAANRTATKIARAMQAGKPRERNPRNVVPIRSA